MQDHGSMNMPQPSGAVGAASAKEPLRGVILIVASKDVVLQGVWDALWRHILILIAAVIVILRIAYLALNHQVIRPLESICDTINRWKSGDLSARAHLTQHDEIKEVAETLNEALDSEDAHGKQLSDINEQLTMAVETAETANVAKSVFLANMSH